LGNLDAGNITTSGLISAGGNITAGNISATNHNGTTLSVTGNITGANAALGNLVSANYFTGDGSLLTNLTTGSQLLNGTSNVVVASNGNVTVGVGSTANVFKATTTGVIVTGTISANGNVTGGNLLFGSGITSGTGNVTGGNLLFGTGQVSGTANITGGNIIGTHVGNVSGAATISASGAITGGNLLFGTGQVSGTGNITGGNLIGTVATASQTNITAIGTLTTLSATGNVTAGNLITAGSLTVNANGLATSIVNGGANGAGNIGSSTNYFNRVFAQATTALYADLAELYAGDADYAPGTVVSFGGTHEVTISQQPNDTRIAGVISTNPSYQMNSGLIADYAVAVALTGRVPTRVMGTVRKGDMMVSAGNGFAKACATPTLGTVIGKSLEDFDGDQGFIEIVVGKL
jgi:hypothetical protein